MIGLSSTILAILCDDDETANTIIAMLNDENVYYGKITRDLVYFTLFELYKENYVKILTVVDYSLRPIKPINVVGVDIKDIEENKNEYWFSITPKGKEFVRINFIRQFDTGYGDYTKERAQAEDNRSVADIVSEIKKRRKKG